MNDWRELKIMVKALGDVARLSIVYHLAHQHEITRAGMIHTRRVGRQVYCSLDKSRYQYCLQRLETLVDPAVQLESFPIGEFLIEAEAVAED